VSRSSLLGWSAAVTTLVALLLGCETIRTSVAASTPRPACAPPPRPSPDGHALAITGVTVIDVAAGVARPDTTVLIRGDRIAAVGPAARVALPAGATVIDGRGKILIPGLWDMHAHVADPGMLTLFTRYGVTGARQMFAINPACRAALGLDRPAGPASPRVVGANQVLDGPDTRFGRLVRGNVLTVADAESARARVRELRDNGNGWVKVYNRLPRPAYFAAVGEARRLGLPVGGHVPQEVTAAEASDAGQRTIEHQDQVPIGCSTAEAELMAELRQTAGPGAKPEDATGWRVQLKGHRSYDPVKGEALFRKFAANRTWHVPTLVQTRSVARLADPNPVDPALLRELPPTVTWCWRREVTAEGVSLPLVGLRYTRADLAERAELFRREVEMIRRMHTAGVRILAGTDTPNPDVFPGLSLHEELELLVGAGLTPAEALRAATLGPAECLGYDADLGAVEPGRLADLVLLAANPLDDIRNTRSVQTVFIGGRPVPGGRNWRLPGGRAGG
jgi:imidazolonepropionase-like amidohydrolase